MYYVTSADVLAVPSISTFGPARDGLCCVTNAIYMVILNLYKRFADSQVVASRDLVSRDPRRWLGDGHM